MRTDFQNNVNRLLPIRVGLSAVPAGGNATAGKIPMFTGSGLVCQQSSGYTPPRQYTVGPGGSYNYSSLLAAVSALPGDITAANPFTILCAPVTLAETGKLVLTDMAAGLTIKGESPTTLTVVTFTDTTNWLQLINSNLTLINIQITKIGGVIANDFAIVSIESVTAAFGIRLVLNNSFLGFSLNTTGNSYNYDVIKLTSCTTFVYVDATNKSILQALSNKSNNISIINSNYPASTADTRLTADSITIRLNWNTTKANIMCSLRNINSGGGLYLSNSTVYTATGVSSALQTVFYLYGANDVSVNTFYNNIFDFRSAGTVAYDISKIVIISCESNSPDHHLLRFTSYRNTCLMSPYGYTPIGNAVYIKSNTVLGSIDSTFDSLGGCIFSGTPPVSFFGGDYPGGIKANTFTCSTGTSISAFSTDGTFSANSDYNVPTQKAVKTYSVATTLPYSVSLTRNWAGSSPTNIKDALDRMASLLVSLNSGSAIP